MIFINEILIKNDNWKFSRREIVRSAPKSINGEGRRDSGGSHTVGPDIVIWRGKAKL